MKDENKLPLQDISKAVEEFTAQREIDLHHDPLKEAEGRRAARNARLKAEFTDAQIALLEEFYLPCDYKPGTPLSDMVFRKDN